MRQMTCGAMSPPGRLLGDGDVLRCVVHPALIDERLCKLSCEQATGPHLGEDLVALPKLALGCFRIAGEGLDRTRDLGETGQREPKPKVRIDPG